MLLVVVCAVPLVIYLYVALHRIGYPYELEWLEGGAAEIVRRVADGRAMYVKPSLHYVPYPYTPLYFWVSGGLAHVTGVGFLPLRLVSLFSSLGCCALLWRIAWRETGDVVAGAVAVGLFTATFAVSGAWLDIGRVDSLALFVLLGAISVARQVTKWPSGVLVGGLVFLAFMAKQDTLIALGPVLLYLVLTRWRVGLAACVTAGTLLVGSTYLLDRATHGWYGYYVFQELTHQGVTSSVWTTFFTKDLFHVPWAIGLGLIGLVFGVVGTSNRTAWGFWSMAWGGLLVSAFISRLHSGGGEDVLIPAYAAAALLGAFGYDALLRYAAAMPLTDSPRWKPWGAVLVGIALTLGIGVQLTALHYSPTRYIPTSADQRAGQRFVALVRHTSGTVVVSNHPYYDTLAGKESWAQGESVHDVLRAGPSTARTDLTASINAFLRLHTPATIFSDDAHYALGSYSDPFFRLVSTHVIECQSCFYPVTDIKRRPSFRFVRG
ncbi:MAG TPA: glycosyltransferase family 39 protein [Acidimicrobiales bacterium]|nr:glycosyltransferase family 39 protein [Acidimicrobiales bacterium]